MCVTGGGGGGGARTSSQPDRDAATMVVFLWRGLQPPLPSRDRGDEGEKDDTSGER